MQTVSLLCLSIASAMCLAIVPMAAAGKYDSLRELLPSDQTEDPPTVLVALLVRNKAHVLPLFLSYFERQSYPKDRISLWIRSDHNSDASVEVLQLWLNHTSSLYHHVDFQYDNTSEHHENETVPHQWTASRFEHLITLKEAAMTHARKIWADFIFYLDADALLTSPETLTNLTGLRLPIVAPMLLSEGLYSNFWCGMTPEYYYQRTAEYREIYNVNKEGVFEVPMVHSALLIHLDYTGSRYLTFSPETLREFQEIHAEWVDRDARKQCRTYDGPLDDIITFAISANCSQIPLFVSNELLFGYILQPLDANDGLQQDMQQLTNIKVNIINDLGSVEPVNDYFQQYTSYPKRNKLTLDHIYMINLERRPERRQKMEALFQELGLDVEYFAAVDGKNLDLEIIDKMGLRMLPEYEDPYHHRQMTMGEIGCFLSHYRIWEKMVELGQTEVLILEDDIRFEPYFKERAMRVLEQARRNVNYDLIYFGRKRLKDESEPWVKNADNLVHVGYSYWTLGYVISLEGARKLLAAKPLEKLVPVDEFLPIMFNRHPNKTLAAAFPERNLNAFSSAPLLLFPTHYTGEVGYISDTENSEVTSDKLFDRHEAQPKSDRELEFPIEEKIGFSTLADPMKSDLHVDITASHDEF